jgi:hypothetical protein
MTPIAEEALKEEEEHLSDKKEYLQNELKSLGIVEPDYYLHNKPNDKEEDLQALTKNIKSVYYQAYKTAYSSGSSNDNSSSSTDSRLANSSTAQIENSKQSLYLLQDLGSCQNQTLKERLLNSTNATVPKVREEEGIRLLNIALL